MGRQRCSGNGWRIRVATRSSGRKTRSTTIKHIPIYPIARTLTTPILTTCIAIRRVRSDRQHFCGEPGSPIGGVKHIFHRPNPTTHLSRRPSLPHSHNTHLNHLLTSSTPARRSCSARQPVGAAYPRLPGARNLESKRDKNQPICKCKQKVPRA
jgi:hypothetical protein